MVQVQKNGHTHSQHQSMRNVCLSVAIMKQAAKQWLLEDENNCLLLFYSNVHMNEGNAWKYVCVHILQKKIKAMCSVQGLESNLTPVLVTSFLQPG